ncbi:unnamed protein product [Sympodiomycopsis kandeliae]
MSRPILLVRQPSPLLSEGQLTHLSPSTSPPTHSISLSQWKGYIEIWRQNGWEVIEAVPADDCPDGVFLEDSVVVFPHLSPDRQGGVAVLPRSGSVERRKEYKTAKQIVNQHLVPRGFEVFDFEEQDPSRNATNDGGDILKIVVPGDKEDPTVYVGLSSRTNQAGFELYRKLLEPRGWKVIGVPVEHHLHLKSAITALPNGQIIGNILFNLTLSNQRE